MPEQIAYTKCHDERKVKEIKLHVFISASLAFLVQVNKLDTHFHVIEPVLLRDHYFVATCSHLNLISVVIYAREEIA